MRSRTWVLAFLVPAAALPCGPTHAAANQIAKGSIEFAPSVAFSHQNFKREGYGNVDHTTELTVSPTMGFCLSNRFEVMGGLLIRHETVNDMHETALGATAALAYNFPPHGQVIPYASFGFGTLFYDGFSFDETAVLAPMLTGGVRVLVGSSASVNMSLGYYHESNAQGEFNASSNRLQAGVGLSIFPWQSGASSENGSQH